jgi:hypothetical protein
MARYLWDLYHGEDVVRDLRRQTLRSRSEQDMIQSLAWLYGGIGQPRRSAFAIPDVDWEAMNVGL